MLHIINKKPVPSGIAFAEGGLRRVFLQTEYSKTTCLVEKQMDPDVDASQKNERLEGKYANYFNDEKPHVYQTGDYWLIPGRTATGDVEWPGPVATPLPLSLSPQGVEHHYAPLCNITVAANGNVSAPAPADDLRRKLKKIWD